MQPNEKWRREKTSLVIDVSNYHRHMDKSSETALTFQVCFVSSYPICVRREHIQIHQNVCYHKTHFSSSPSSLSHWFVVVGAVTDEKERCERDKRRTTLIEFLRRVTDIFFLSWSPPLELQVSRMPCYMLPNCIYLSWNSSPYICWRLRSKHPSDRTEIDSLTSEFMSLRSLSRASCSTLSQPSIHLKSHTFSCSCCFEACSNLNILL